MTPITDHFREGPRVQLTPLQPQPGTEGHDLLSAHQIDGLEDAVARAAREHDLDPDSPKALVAAIYGEEGLDETDPMNRLRLHAAERVTTAREDVRNLPAWADLRKFKERLHETAVDLAKEEWEKVKQYGASPEVRRHFQEKREEELGTLVSQYLDLDRALRERVVADGPSEPKLDANSAARISLELEKVRGRPDRVLRDRLLRAADQGDLPLVHHLRDELTMRLEEEGIDPDAPLRELDAVVPHLARARQAADLALTGASTFGEAQATRTLDEMRSQLEMVARQVEENADAASRTLHDTYPAWRDAMGSTLDETAQIRERIEDQLFEDTPLGWDGPRARMSPRATPHFPPVGPAEERAHPDAPTFDGEDGDGGRRSTGFFSQYPGSAGGD